MKLAVFLSSSCSLVTPTVPRSFFHCGSMLLLCRPIKEGDQWNRVPFFTPLSCDHVELRNWEVCSLQCQHAMLLTTTHTNTHTNSNGIVSKCELTSKFPVTGSNPRWDKSLNQNKQREHNSSYRMELNPSICPSIHPSIFFTWSHWAVRCLTWWFSCPWDASSELAEGRCDHPKLYNTFFRHMYNAPTLLGIMLPDI